MFENVKKVASKLTYAVPVIVFLGFIFYITSMTYTGRVQRTIENTKWSFDSFVALSNQFEEVLQKGIYKKFGFINLDGLIAKTLGFNSLNQRQKLANGYLAEFGTAKDVTISAKNTIGLNNFLKERGIPFLYILVPWKDSFYDAKFAPGYTSESRKNITNMIDALNSAGVKTLNMDAWFKEHDWHMEETFFKTDHHWLPRAGLAAAQRTMEILQQQGIAEYDSRKLSEKNYKIKVYKNWFLGSDGKRVGKYFAGVDDIAIYYPKFKTKYSYSWLKTGTTDWHYSNTPLRMENLAKKDFFTMDPHRVYLDLDAGYQLVTNSEARDKRTVLFLGDSFRRSLHYFLSTQFQKTYGFDFRRYWDSTLAQCIEEIKPDIVIMCITESLLLDKQLNEFGVDEYNQALAKTGPAEPKVSLGSFEIPAREGNDNFVTIGKNLAVGQSYTLVADSAKVLEGKARHIQITLQDLTTNKPVVNHYLEVARKDKQKWIFTVPNESDNYALYLYAGTKGYTAGNSVKVTNILLQQGIHEE